MGAPALLEPLSVPQTAAVLEHGVNPRGGVRAAGLELLPVSLALLTLRGAELPVSGSSHCPDPGNASGSCASGSIPRATAGRGAQQEDAVVS